MGSYRNYLNLLALLIIFVFTDTASSASDYTFTTLASFNGLNGSWPQAGVVFDSEGNLYGTTNSGGAANTGTVFKFDPTSGTLNTLTSFTYPEGQTPEAQVTFGPNGMLYGTTYNGGAGGSGTLFKLNPATGALTTFVSFNGPNGIWPQAGLSLDSSGRLYGTTKHGGTLGGYGTVFRFDPSSETFTTLKSFSGTNGAQPIADLLSDGSGKFYGTTSTSLSGYGTIFKLDPSTGDLTTLRTFTGMNGREPHGSLVLDSAGNLYGTTVYGGELGHGTVYRLNTTTGVLTTLVSFNGSNGDTPLGGLTSDSEGNLYGTTGLGGESGNGTVFRVNPANGELTTLVSFNNTNGHLPYGAVIADSQGNLYSTTGFGGEFNYGTVFKLSPTVAGDFDADGDVDGRDFLAWQRNPSVGDLTDWRANYGIGSLVAMHTAAEAASPVPEPTSAVMLLIFIVIPARLRFAAPRG